MVKELMRAPISVVIPTLNDAAVLPGTLAALAEGLDAGLIRELVVADGGSTDGTLRMAEAAGADVIQTEIGQIARLQRGVKSSHGAWVLALRPDAVLSRGWSAAVLGHLHADAKDPAFFQLRSATPGTWSRAQVGWANMKANRAHHATWDHGLLMPRKIVAAQKDTDWCTGGMRKWAGLNLQRLDASITLANGP